MAPVWLRDVRPTPRSVLKPGRRSENWLVRRYHRCGDRNAREELVRSLAPLVRAEVARYHQPRFEQDLTQAACLGLTKAIDRFDERRGRDLRAYAIPTMRGEMRRWLRDNAWTMHLPRPLQERVLAVTRAIDELAARDGRPPTPQQLAEQLDLSLEQVLDALVAGRTYRMPSLETPIGEPGEGLTLADVVGAPDAGLERAEALATLRTLRDVIDDRERDVLRLRFKDDLTQAQIAAELGCSQMQVSRILRRALDRLAGRAAIE
jgi:RNA polymerase sigma-B factor